MDYNASIKAAVDFIEEHLFETLSPSEVAAKVGFSEYHFHRIFYAMLGESMAAYIRKRRISEAETLLIETDRPVLDIAIETGFESNESFSRAFKKVYSKSPSEFRILKNALLTYQKKRVTMAMIEHLQAGINLVPKFELYGPEIVVGMAAGFSEGQHAEIGQLWERFIPRLHEIENALSGLTYGVCLATHPDITKGSHSMIYLAGLPVTRPGAIPDGMVACAIQRSKYAVFTHKGSLDTLPETVNYIWGTWIPKNNHKHHHVSAPDFERYDSRFHPETRSGEFDIYIPIVEI